MPWSIFIADLAKRDWSLIVEKAFVILWISLIWLWTAPDFNDGYSFKLPFNLHKHNKCTYLFEMILKLWWVDFLGTGEKKVNDIKEEAVFGTNLFETISREMTSQAGLTNKNGQKRGYKPFLFEITVIKLSSLQIWIASWTMKTYERTLSSSSSYFSYSTKSWYLNA